jgi:signal transduction histidine kinase
MKMRWRPSTAWRGSDPADHPLVSSAAAFVSSALFFGLIAVAIPLRGVTPLIVVWILVCVGAVVAIGRRLGPQYGVPFAIAAGVAFDSFYIPPTRPFGHRYWDNWVAVAVYIGLAVSIGALAAGTRRRADVSESGRVELADEQAALRRVATLVARGAEPDVLFRAVAAEVENLVGSDLAAIVRFDPDGTATPIVGTHVHQSSDDVAARVRSTGRPARSRAAIASPIVVDGELWGAISVATLGRALPEPTERRLADFTELVATAIANAEAHAELTASRARVIAAADEAMRRIEHDLHDGAQQRLASVVLKLQTAQSGLPVELEELRSEFGEASDELVVAIDELRDYARGIHPAVLTSRGLEPALKALARRSVVPVELDVQLDTRLPAATETGAYFVVSEALMNAAKHARASAVVVEVTAIDSFLRVSVRDDGIGGASVPDGSGLIGLQDRVAAVGGRISIDSPHGSGTAITVELPVSAPE